MFCDTATVPQPGNIIVPKEAPTLEAIHSIVRDTNKEELLKMNFSKSSPPRFDTEVEQTSSA